MSNRFRLVKEDIDAHCVDNRRGRVRQLSPVVLEQPPLPALPPLPSSSSPTPPLTHSLFSLSVAGDLYYTWSAPIGRTHSFFHHTCSILTLWKQIFARRYFFGLCCQPFSWVPVRTSMSYLGRAIPLEILLGDRRSFSSGSEPACRDALGYIPGILDIRYLHYNS